ncbi:DUF2946 domain-containing protein [Cupriavidus sp. UME77]|uniref:DUF2946 domain-containing protein n=1 Tax=Cupriavidus sp. UME77 TaxID=1862321 RepID=UPI0016026BC0|nr:DUF2946 domain-containing protein [Cupriavidus sp. UME77]MBB1631637.1 hypothetical protein [Cupriavidus sp. UME77]
MTLIRRIRLTAWLGLIAMWLIVLAPAVSQFVAAAQASDPEAVICSAAHPGDAPHDMPGSSLNACGYCDLLADHMPLPTLAPAALSAIPLLVVATSHVLVTRFTPLGAFPSGRPRDPPALPQSSL